jgi:hypothetical protein
VAKKEDGRGKTKIYDIDPNTVEKLAHLGLSQTAIAEYYGCTPDLIRKSYSENFKKGSRNKKKRLLEATWKAIENGNSSVIIFALKNMLGWSDNPGETNDTQITVKFKD